VEEVSAAAEEMSAQVEEVTASAQSLAEMAETLQQVVAQFKLTEKVTSEEARFVQPPSTSLILQKSNGHSKQLETFNILRNNWRGN